MLTFENVVFMAILELFYITLKCIKIHVIHIVVWYKMPCWVGAIHMCNLHQSYLVPLDAWDIESSSLVS
jgi:hypothetical protein